MNEAQHREMLRRDLKAAMNKVPDRINSGTIRDTRIWVESRNKAAALLKKSSPAIVDLLNALKALQ